MYFYSEGPKFPILSDHSQGDGDDNDSQMCHRRESTDMLGLEILSVQQQSSVLFTTAFTQSVLVLGKHSWVHVLSL